MEMKVLKIQNAVMKEISEIAEKAYDNKVILKKYNLQKTMLLKYPIQLSVIDKYIDIIFKEDFKIEGNDIIPKNIKATVDDKQK